MSFSGVLSGSTGCLNINWSTMHSKPKLQTVRLQFCFSTHNFVGHHLSISVFCQILVFVQKLSVCSLLCLTNLKSEKLIKKQFLLLQYSKFMPGKDLIKLYVALVRSNLEYSSVTLASQLSKYQRNRLKQVQKQCLDTTSRTTNYYISLA